MKYQYKVRRMNEHTWLVVDSQHVGPSAKIMGYYESRRLAREIAKQLNEIAHNESVAAVA